MIFILSFMEIGQLILMYIIESEDRQMNHTQFSKNGLKGP